MDQGFLEIFGKLGYFRCLLFYLKLYILDNTDTKLAICFSEAGNEKLNNADRAHLTWHVFGSHLRQVWLERTVHPNI